MQGKKSSHFGSFPKRTFRTGGRQQQPEGPCLGKPAGAAGRRTARQAPGREESSFTKRSKKLRNGILAAVAVTVVGGIAWAKFSANNSPDEAEPLFKVRKGDLQISVLEAGRIQAQKSVSLSCEMDGGREGSRGGSQGGITIISIVPEGTLAKEGDVLVELDSADLRERIDSQEITVNSAEAGLRTAEEAFDIQKNQNDSYIRAAELSRDFALIDLKKYTGEAAYAKALEAHRSQNGDQTGAGLTPFFANLKPDHYVDGDWHQQLLKAQNDITTAETALKLAENKLKGTQKLKAKDYVTQTELEADQFNYDKAEIALEQAGEEKKLIIKYDHPKQLARFIANYEEAEKELGRVSRKAASRLAQKQVDLDAQKATYRMEKERLDRHKEQLSKATIKAPQPGLVVYASSSRGGRSRHRRGRIAEGETVYRRQQIIELPDLSSLKVRINLQESVRDMVKPGQQAIITFEAAPDVTLRGHVDKVALVPDSEQNWMNPDLALYPATILVEGKSEAITPGMTAKVEIIVADLKDVLYVPVQAVTIRRNRDVCYVVKGAKRKETPAEVGLSNNHYIQIKSGLREGDRVLTNAPVTLAKATALKKPEVTEFEKKWAPRPDQAAARPKSEEEKPEKAPADMEESAKAFLQNLTPEQKKAMQERLKGLGITEEIDLENMTPEKMQQLRRKLMEGAGRRGRGPEGAEGSPRRRGPRAGRRPPGSSGPRRRDTGERAAPRNQ